MALDKLTKIDGGGISTTSDYRVGVITATKFVGPFEGTITSTDANFTGNVTIGGTLTYEDVTNIDSIGIITARNNIDCNADLDVDGHTNLDNVSIAGVTTTTGNIHLNSGAKVGFATDSNTFIGQDDYDRLDFNVGGKRLASIVEGTNIPVLVIDKDGINNARSNQNTNYNANPNATELVLGNTSSNNHGMTIVSPSSGYGNIQFSDGSGGGLDSTRGTIVFTHSDNKLNLKSKIGSIALTHKDDEKLVTTDAGISIPKDLDVDGHTNLDNVSIAGVSTFSSNATFSTNVLVSGKVRIENTSYAAQAAGNELIVGTTTGDNGITIASGSSGTGNLYFGDGDSNSIGYIRYDHNSNFLKINVNGSERLRITSDGYVQINDDSKFLQIGAGQDLDLHHNGTNSYIRNKTGNLHIRPLVNEEGIILKPNAEVELYYNNVEKLSTLNDGISVSGHVKLTAQLIQSMPADYWSQGNTFIELNGLGNLTHMGGYETNLTSNGYRDTNGQWVSYSANSQSGAAQIGLTPTGYIKFRTDYSKSNGTSHNPTDRVIIDPYGRVLIGGSSAIIGSSSEFNEIVLTGKTRGAGITLQDVDANTRFQIRTDDNGDGTLLNASTNHPLVIRTNNTERLRIASDGKVGINQSSPINMFEVVTDFGLADNTYKVNTQYRSGNNASGYTASGLQIVSTADNSNGDKNTAYLSFSNRDPALNGSHGASAFITMTTPDSPGTYGTGQFDFYCRNGAPYAFPNDPQAASNYWMDPLLTIKSNHKIGINSTSPQSALDVTHNDGAYIKSVTNGAGAKVRFSDNGAESFTQIGTLEYKHQNNVIIDGMEEAFRFAGTEGTMGVQIEGLLKVTAQPCAVVYQCTGPSGGAVNSSTDNLSPLHFDHVHINQGGMAISQDNGRITVPVSGIYFVSFMVSGGVTTIDTNDGIELLLLRNGSEYPSSNSGIEPVFNFGHGHTGSGSNVVLAAHSEFACSNTILVSLSKDDYVEVAFDNISGADANINRGNFCVMLMA